MKRLYWTITSVTAVGFLATGSAAQAKRTQDTLSQRSPYDRLNTVWIIGADPQSDSLRETKGRAVDLYASTVKRGFQQSGVRTF